jgi:hypothetical protein
MFLLAFQIWILDGYGKLHFLILFYDELMSVERRHSHRLFADVRHSTTDKSCPEA